MSFFAGLTLEKHCVILSDRRRLILKDKPTYDDSVSKIWKIRKDLYVTGAGLIHFIDGYLKLVLPMVVKDSPLEMALLRPKLPEWQVEFSQKYREMNQSVLSQLESKGLDVNEQKSQVTSAMLGGIDSGGVPFLLGFHSSEDFTPHLVHGEFKRMVLPLFGADMEESIKLTQWINTEFSKRATTLKRISRDTDRAEQAVKILAGINRLVAAKDKSVSPSCDIAIIGPTGSAIQQVSGI